MVEYRQFYVIKTNITILLMRKLRLRECQEQTQVSHRFHFQLYHIIFLSLIAMFWEDNMERYNKHKAWYIIRSIFFFYSNQLVLMEKQKRNRLAPFPRQSGVWGWERGLLVPWAEHEVQFCLPQILESGNMGNLEDSNSAQGQIRGKGGKKQKERKSSSINHEHQGIGQGGESE